jgi:hypothetical protein
MAATGNDGASVYSASGHSQDEDAFYEEDVLPAAAPFVPEASHKEEAVLGATREIRCPNRLRQDVGTLGIFCGNWGGSKRNGQPQIDEDLRMNPAAIMLLQEAQPELAETLQQLPPNTRDGGKGGGEERRQAREWWCYRGEEPGNTLMVACRKNMVCDGIRLVWRKRADGPYTDRNVKARPRRMAISRLEVVALTLNAPWCGQTRVVVCNVHMHYLTAKRAPGFAAAHNAFWQELAAMIVKHGVRILGGDFNMSLWVVAQALRGRGVETHFAAGYAWRESGARKMQALSDSCGIFLIGPTTAPPTTLWGPDDFFAATELPAFIKGQGYQLASYLPRYAAAEEAMRETFAPSMEGRLTRDWPALPPAVQTRVHVERFDPDKLLFRGGAHMPLLIFMGEKNKGRRAVEALQRREVRARERRGWAAHRGEARSHGHARWRNEGSGRGKWQGEMQSTPAIAGDAQEPWQQPHHQQGQWRQPLRQWEAPHRGWHSWTSSWHRAAWDGETQWQSR